MLICLLTIGIKILVYFHWYLLIYLFQLVSMKIYIDLFDVTPLLILCFEQKGGKEFVGFVFTLTPLLMIDKKGEKDLSLYACFYDYACFYIGIKYWYQVRLF